ncbi:hypothetical protein Tco_0134321 [Tanacetum coccineum]
MESNDGAIPYESNLFQEILLKMNLPDHRIKQRWRWRHLVPVKSIHHPMLTLNASKAAVTPLVVNCRMAASVILGAADINAFDSLVDLIGDEDSTDEDGDIGVLVSLGDEIFSEGKKSRESNIGDSDNIRNGGKTAGRAIITWGGGIASLISKSEGTIVE